ncbi:hypothetical protein MHI24_18110 [Paenibacillus sp. FSL K6-1096]|uniref:hypothetical protein n=1 Tax=Paenibacillus sp. FSL K6-1096 TaxID=2921460 RepID=UPI0030ED8FE2
MKNLRNAVPLLVLSLLLVLVPLAGQAAASATVITSSVEASFGLTAATADSAGRAKLNGLFSELKLLSGQYDRREAEIRSLHDQNTAALKTAKEAVKNIDLAAITRQSAAVTSAKARYQPLFDQYSALNKRISLLKGLKDKTLNSVLRAQSEAMKLLVQAARQDIRDKEALLKATKATRTRKVAAVRKTLAGMDSLQSRIKSQRSAAAALNKRLTADWSDFKAAIRKKNSSLAGQSLSSAVSGYRQIAACKLKIIEHEQAVAGVIAAALKQARS